MIKYFNQHKVLSCVLAMMLTLTTTNFACNTAKWLDTVGKYLPTAIQVAQSIVSLVGLFAPASTNSDQVVVKQIGDEATKDYQLLDKLYEQYKAAPSPDTRTQSENALATITTNLPAELEAAHIKDPVLLQKVTAAVNILMTVADVIIAQMPVSNPTLVAHKAKAKAGLVKATPATIKAQWDSVVCANEPICTALVK